MTGSTSWLQRHLGAVCLSVSTVAYTGFVIYATVRHG